MGRTPVGVIVVFSLIACACGDGEGDDLQERITEAAYERACEEARNLLISQYSGDYFVQALCTAEAVEGTTNAAACGNELDACINNPPAEVRAGIDRILNQAGCNLLEVDTATCSSTLGEVKACLEAIDDEVAGLQYTLTCAAAGQTLDDWDIVELPASCGLASDC